MAERRVLIIGSGKRVCEAALPVFESADELFDIAGVYSRSAKRIESTSRGYEVQALDALTPGTLKSVDLVYMVVSKPAVPSVVARLTQLDPSGTDLLIETPVMLFRHYGHLDALRAFRNVWVSEDTKTLPCFAPVRALEAAGELGSLRSVLFEESAYAYHGVAMLKSILGAVCVKRARQTRRADGRRDRVFSLQRADGSLRIGRIIDPRDYARGTLRFEFEGGVVADHALPDTPGALRLQVDLDAGRAIGFRVGEHLRELDAAESTLMGTAEPGAGLTAWMDGMKRVGFLELVRDIAAGRGAYPLDDAVEDAVVDYHLERFKRYFVSPLTDPRRRLTRWSYKLLTKLARG